MSGVAVWQVIFHTSLLWFQQPHTKSQCCSCITCIDWPFTLYKSSKQRNTNSIFFFLKKMVIFWTFFSYNFNWTWPKYKDRNLHQLFSPGCGWEREDKNIRLITCSCSLSSLTGWWECPSVSHPALRLLGAKSEVGLVWCNLHSSQRTIAY